jgi:hypothetical protein
MASTEDQTMPSAERRPFGPTIERWLREEVVPVVTAMQADPGRAVPAAEVFAEIRAMHAKRSRTP